MTYSHKGKKMLTFFLVVHTDVIFPMTSCFLKMEKLPGRRRPKEMTLKKLAINNNFQMKLKVIAKLPWQTQLKRKCENLWTVEKVEKLELSLG